MVRPNLAAVRIFIDRVRAVSITEGGILYAADLFFPNLTEDEVYPPWHQLIHYYPVRPRVNSYDK